VAGHIFQARPVWIYTQSNITNIIIKLFHDGLDNGLHVLNRADDVIKEQQYETLKAVTVDKRDCLIVLPTGFGKSLIFQLLPFVFEYTLSLKPSTPSTSIIVVSPLNALMHDQVSKLKESITVSIVKNKYDTCDSCETGASYDLKEIISNMPRIIFAHPESLVSDKRALKLLKAKKCQTCVSAIVVDEAHLVIDW
jgi:ATP-dependent DNA helicase RecQ